MIVTREGEVFLPHDPCRDKVKNILAMIHGDLSTPEEKDLLAHLEHCPGCASFLELHELIDDEFQSYFTAERIVVPTEIPKKVGIQLALTRKKNLAMWLHELGRAIFFQQPEAVDRYHPGRDPYKYDRCIEVVENVCSSTLEDPFLEVVGLSRELVNDCGLLVQELKKCPQKILVIESSKELLDRSLLIEPESVFILKTLSDYFRFTNDYPSAVRELTRALRVSNTKEETWSLHGRLSSLFYSMADFSSSFVAIEKARNICNDFRIDLLNCRNYIKLRDIQKARKSLELMDKKIGQGLLPSFDKISLNLMYKWAAKNFDNVISQMAYDELIVKIMTKYKGRSKEG